VILDFRFWILDWLKNSGPSTLADDGFFQNRKSKI
jgi:hypothetical protein